MLKKIHTQWYSTVKQQHTKAQHKTSSRRESCKTPDLPQPTVLNCLAQDQANTCTPCGPLQHPEFVRQNLTAVCVYPQLRRDSPSYSMPVSLSSRDGVAALALQAQHTQTHTERCRLSAHGCVATHGLSVESATWRRTHNGPAGTVVPAFHTQPVSTHLSTDLLGYTMHRITCSPPKIAPTCRHTQQQAALQLCCAGTRHRAHQRSSDKQRMPQLAG
jgi:hypothetical protein